MNNQAEPRQSMIHKEMKEKFKTAAQVIVPFIILFFLMQLLGAFIR